MRWLGNQSAVPPESVPEVALAVLDAPCVLRSLAQKALDQAGRSWRIDFVSASLGGVWAAVRAGLGVTVRTKIGLPPGVFYVLGLPELPSLGLILHRASPNPAPGIAALEKILLSALEPVLRPGGAV